ncbi:ECF transporter S component [Microbacterium oleivorans]|uniref:ECF transporter S component n=1 Tax=Microbacterium oleivorans TaxID=273677 RepID=UPI002040FC00|nr:ECF transporter S component [Microbacterium oleivorans]MCM3697075.1 ECF transporter S component [Microbacterium oleivorans]
MSDPQFGERNEQTREPAYGEPVEEPTAGSEPRDVDHVVGSANDSLAEAEAASRTTDDRPRGDTDFTASDRGSDLSIDYGKYGEPDAPVTASAADGEPLYRPAATESAPESSATADTEVVDAPAHQDETPEPAAAPAATAAAPAVATAAYTHTDQTPTTVTSSEPAAAAAPTAVYSQQPIFVQAPEAPRPRGNRGAAGAIGLVAAVVFAVLYLAATLGLAALSEPIAVAELGQRTLDILTTWAFWVPVAVFFLGFWILGAFINRGRWGLWVVFGLLVGAAAYGGHLLGQLFQAPFWSIAPSQAGQIVSEQLLAPLAVIAFVLGREITVWFGAWVARRGRRVTELNDEAQREYERTLEAGPQLHQY